MVQSIILCSYYVILAGIIFTSMKGNEKVLFYFGFLRGNLSRSFFLLFCASLVFPMTPERSDKYDWLNTTAGMGLVLVAVLQIFKICRKEDNDVNNSEAMMDGKATNRSFIEDNQDSYSGNQALTNQYGYN